MIGIIVGEIVERYPPDTLMLNQVRVHYLFSSMSAEEFSRCTAHSEVIELSPSEMLFRQGERASRFFMVLSGVIRLFLASHSGGEKVVELVSPGKLFAEAVFFMGGQYPVHAAAVDRTRVLGVDFEGFNSCLRDNPDLSFRMMAAMSARIHSMLREIEQLTLGNACQRLAIYLLDAMEGHAAGEPVRLKAPKAIIASRIGVKPETLSRLLARFKDEDILSVRHDTVVVNDIGRLKAVLTDGLNCGTAAQEI